MSSIQQSTQNVEIPSILGHVSIGTNQFEKAVAFYDRVLATIGAKRIIEIDGFAIAWGKQFPEFWVQKPHDGQVAETANGIHFAFLATSKQMVDDFYSAGIANGARDDGKPGPRVEYSEAYYGCFMRDLEGHKIEAMYWDEATAPVTEHN